VDPVKHLRTELERGISRAWDSLTEGWREMLSRSSGALTHYVRAAKREQGDGGNEDFPNWALLAAECWETAKSVIVRLELPGVNKEDIDVSIHGSTLRIRGEKRSGGDRQGRLYHMMERAYGRFERTISLPQNIDGKRAEVSYQDGVVTVIVPKTEPSPPTHLTIK
jgi:HSP20 family protein